MVRTAKNKLTAFSLTQSCTCHPFYKNGKCFGTFHHYVLADELLTKFETKFWGKNAI